MLKEAKTVATDEAVTTLRAALHDLLEAYEGLAAHEPGWLGELTDPVYTAAVAALRETGGLQERTDCGWWRVWEPTPTSGQSMPEPAVPRYYVVDERVEAFNRAKEAKVAAGRRYGAVNTREAHWAADYGDPHTELQQAARAHDAAEMALREAHDRLVVTCAYLCTINDRLGALLRQKVPTGRNHESA